jgi:hypothetical protein
MDLLEKCGPDTYFQLSTIRKQEQEEQGQVEEGTSSFVYNSEFYNKIIIWLIYGLLVYQRLICIRNTTELKLIH